MSLAISILSVAHMHAHGYAQALGGRDDIDLKYVWDDDANRGRKFAAQYGAEFTSDRTTAIAESNAVIITSENLAHIDHLEAAHAARKPALCEKPIIGSLKQTERLRELLKDGARIMTAFPCRYSPAFHSALAKIRSGAIGEIQAICATNRGRCPFGWFTEVEKSGGGAMIDHVVHVADLLRVILGESPSSVTAQTGSNMYSHNWEDTAMLSLTYPSGVFATLDSSWSRPQNYKTWGDVTMNIVGDKGVIELDLFSQQFERYSQEPSAYHAVGYGSDIDAGLVVDFLRFAKGEIEAPISAADGLAAVQVAFDAYASVHATN